MINIILRQFIRESLIRELQTGGAFGIVSTMKTPDDPKVKDTSLIRGAIDIINKIFDEWSNVLSALVGAKAFAEINRWHEARINKRINKNLTPEEVEAKRKSPLTQEEINKINAERKTKDKSPLTPEEIKTKNANINRTGRSQRAIDPEARGKVKRRNTLATGIIIAGTAAYIWATSDDEGSGETEAEITKNNDRVTAIFNNINNNINNDKFKLEEIENLTDDANKTKFNTYIDKIKQEFINNTDTYSGTISTYYGGNSIDTDSNPEDFDISHAFAAGKVYEKILVNIIDALKINLNIKAGSPEYNKLGELVKEAGSTKIMNIYFELNKVAK